MPRTGHPTPRPAARIMTRSERRLKCRNLCNGGLRGVFMSSVLSRDVRLSRRCGSRLLAIDLLELADAVLAADDADGARAAAHHDRLGGGPIGEEPDTLDQGPVGDPRAGEEDVVPLTRSSSVRTRSRS